MRKRVLNLLLLLMVLLLAVGCNSNKQEKSESDQDNNVIESEVSDNETENVDLITDEIIVGATAGSASYKVLEVAVNKLRDEGHNISLQLFDDVFIPNVALDEGSIDFTFHQHMPFLTEYNRANGTDLVAVDEEGVYKGVFGLFSSKIDSLDDVTDGMTVAIMAEGSNKNHNLEMLEQAGLIKVEAEEGKFATVFDITENPHNLDIKELSSAVVYNTQEDLDLFAYWGPEWVEKGNSMDEALFVLPFDSGATVLAARPDNVDSKEADLIQDALTSPEVKAFIEESFGETVVTTF